MKFEKKINVGIGFVTGRKNFKNVVKTYLGNWNKSSTADNKTIALHLFIAYDLKYTSTQASDYNITDEGTLDTVDAAYYLGKTPIENEAQNLVEKKVVNLSEAKLIFGEGYAMKRNIVLYYALKNKMDYLIFLDDDEYPVASLKIDGTVFWKGQEVISTHLNHIGSADMTHGHHCGYISPIPHLHFNDILTEQDFRLYVEAISNDIINWEMVKEKMNEGGITYARLDVIQNKTAEYVEEINGMKFISGANLGFNLKHIDKVFPFYNPPGARGEDAFLSTCISSCSIRKVPCYTFHDGFGIYKHLLFGVLPEALTVIRPDKGIVTRRFLKASIGWIRYKPLLIYITDREHFDAQMSKIRSNLECVLPKICSYFENQEFMDILKELDFYISHVEKHYKEFEKTKSAWLKIVRYLQETG